MKIPKKTSDNINVILDQVSNTMRSYLDREMADLGLTRSQWFLLCLLYFEDGTNQQELASLMGIGKGTLGKLAHKLENKGWIVRTINTDDARVMNLFISKQSYSMVRKLVELLSESSKRSLINIDKAEISLAKSVLNRMKSNIDNIPPSNKWLKIKRELTQEVNALNR